MGAELRQLRSAADIERNRRRKGQLRRPNNQIARMNERELCETVEAVVQYVISGPGRWRDGFILFDDQSWGPWPVVTDHFKPHEIVLATIEIDDIAAWNRIIETTDGAELWEDFRVAIIEAGGDPGRIGVE